MVILPTPCCSVLVSRGYVNEDDFSHTVSGESSEKMIVRGSKRVTAFWFCVAVEFSNQSQVMRVPLSSHRFSLVSVFNAYMLVCVTSRSKWEPVS